MAHNSSVHPGLVLALRRIGLVPDMVMVLEFDDSGNRAIPALSGSLLDWICEWLPETGEGTSNTPGILQRDLDEPTPRRGVCIEHGEYHDRPSKKPKCH